MNYSNNNKKEKKKERKEKKREKKREKKEKKREKKEKIYTICKYQHQHTIFIKSSLPNISAVKVEMHSFSDEVFIVKS